MNDDFLLGREFYSRTEGLNPDSSQKLLALVIDFTGADDELASAFRLLFSNPIYASLFIARKNPSIAELASLSSLSSRCLSSALAARVDNFARGFFASGPSSQLAQDSVYSEIGKTNLSEPVASFPKVSRESSTADFEDATLFVDETGSVESPASGSAVLEDKPQKVSKNSVLPTKTIVFICIGLAAVIASFKVPAICEPFGLCDKKSEKSSDKNPGSESESTISDPESELPPEAVPDSPPVGPDSPATEASPRYSEAPVHSRPPVASPSRDVPPSRDQPLW